MPRLHLGQSDKQNLYLETFLRSNILGHTIYVFRPSKRLGSDAVAPVNRDWSNLLAVRVLISKSHYLEHCGVQIKLRFHLKTDLNYLDLKLVAAVSADLHEFLDLIYRNVSPVVLQNWNLLLPSLNTSHFYLAVVSFLLISQARVTGRYFLVLYYQQVFISFNNA